MKTSRADILFCCCQAMLISLFFSRAALSVTIIAFVAFSFFHTHIKEQLRVFFANPLLWGMSLLFLFPLLSGLWSEDKTQWLEIIRIKLPLFFLPLAFASPFKFSKQHGYWLVFTFIILVIVGTAWSMFHYAADTAAINESYLKAKSIITPLQNDHVRFSWIVTMAVVLSVFIYYKREKEKFRWLLWLAAGWMVLYLHILAARTGLLSFYLVLVIAAFYVVAAKLNLKYGIILICIVLLLPLIAWFTLPTFSNRIRYMLYDFEYVKDGGYLPGGNDAMRVISMKAGLNIMRESPLTGVGFGDIKTATNKWYNNNYPGMNAADKILPSSEFIIYGAGAGWPGLLLITLVLFIPFFTRVTERLPWILLNATAAFSLVADIGLEVQVGVFLYAFIVLWWWKWLSEEKI
jgi:hypothetical protein